MFAMSNPVEYSIEHLADVSKDIPNMVVQLSFLVMSGIIFWYLHLLRISKEQESV